MKPTFPAILIGGPPHSGKSVLVYSITQALRDKRISHYALRACPDGEGDWANEIRQDAVRSLRIKGCFSPEFTQKVIAYLQRRHLPLLVDVGGKPKEEQKEIFSQCTHAILLVGDQPKSPETYEQNLADWRQMMQEKGVPIIAEIQSTLTAENDLTQTNPILVGRQAGLDRGAFAQGSVFEALIDKITALFSFEEAYLAEVHEKMRPRGAKFIDLPRLSSEISAGNRFWEAQDLPELLARVPPKQDVSVYGRSPIWIYTALAMNAYPAPFASFDAKLGWVLPPMLPTRAVTKDDDWDVQLDEKESYLLLEMSSRSQYLDIDDPEKIPLPPITTDKGLMLSGRLPIWIYCAVARQYADNIPWIAIYQPNQIKAGIVVYTKEPTMPVGTIISKE